MDWIFAPSFCFSSSSFPYEHPSLRARCDSSYIKTSPLFLHKRCPLFFFFFANPLFRHFRLRVGTALLIAINVIGRKLVLTLELFFFLIYIYLLFVNVGIVLGCNYGFQNIWVFLPFFSSYIAKIKAEKNLRSSASCSSNK